MHDEIPKHWCMEGEPYRQEALQLRIVKSGEEAKLPSR